jgi:hypothetical protein
VFALRGFRFASLAIGTLDDMTVLVLLILVVAVIGLIIWSSSRASGQRSAAALADAKADARRVIDRLGGQVFNLTADNNAAQQALADASERLTAASAQVDQASTVRQAALAKQSALEGLYYVRGARTAMGMDPGPELESLYGQSSAGMVTEDRRVTVQGRPIEASPSPSAATPNYYPGGQVAGRPVPAGWYSEPWWKPALIAGAWGVGSALLFDSLFSGMHGVGYGVSGFESGFGDGYSSGFEAGLDQSYDNGGFDSSGFDSSGFDNSGWGGGGDGGGWDLGGMSGGGDFGGDFGGGDF